MSTTADIAYPTQDEVNQLIETADDMFGFDYCWDNIDEYKRLLTAARNCKGEALAYHALAKFLRG